jgi:DnaJ-class molecular chaperone
MVVKEHGFPKFERASERGDLFIEFSISFPSSISLFTADQKTAFGTLL